MVKNISDWTGIQSASELFHLADIDREEFAKIIANIRGTLFSSKLKERCSQYIQNDERLVRLVLAAFFNIKLDMLLNV